MWLAIAKTSIGCFELSVRGGHWGGDGFLGPVGHRQMMNPSVKNLEHRPS